MRPKYSLSDSFSLVPFIVFKEPTSTFLMVGNGVLSPFWSSLWCNTKTVMALNSERLILQVSVFCQWPSHTSIVVVKSETIGWTGHLSQGSALQEINNLRFRSCESCSRWGHRSRPTRRRSSSYRWRALRKQRELTRPNLRAKDTRKKCKQLCEKKR